MAMARTKYPRSGSGALADVLGAKAWWLGFLRVSELKARLLGDILVSRVNAVLSVPRQAR